MLIDLRANEMVALRRKTRALAATLAEIEGNARVNDKILLTLHNLSLLLIRKPANWRARSEALLKKNFSLAHCALVTFDSHSPPDKQSPLAKRVARLPAGGRAFNAPLPGAPALDGARRYFYLPLKKPGAGKADGMLAGMLVLTSKKAEAFPAAAARDFSRRLAELLSAAL